MTTPTTIPDPILPLHHDGFMCPTCGLRCSLVEIYRQHWRLVHGVKADRTRATQEAAKKQKRATAGVGLKVLGHLAPRTAEVQRDGGPLAKWQIKFAEQHGMLCTWCKEPVRLDVGKHHDLAPTVEHIIPLSVKKVVPRVMARSGETSSNEALAHKICNQMRSAIAEEAFRKLMAGEAVTYQEMWPHRPFPPSQLALGVTKNEESTGDAPVLDASEKAEA